MGVRLKTKKLIKIINIIVTKNSMDPVKNSHILSQSNIFMIISTAGILNF